MVSSLNQEAFFFHFTNRYNHGGYYFDIDVQVVNPVLPHPLQTFVTGSCVWLKDTCLWQAVLASTPRHPVLQHAADEMLAYYERNAPQVHLNSLL
jgi:hypothetical protein